MRAALLAGACSAVQGARSPQHGGSSTGGTCQKHKRPLCRIRLLPPTPPLPPPPAPRRCTMCLLHECPLRCTNVPCLAVAAAAPRPVWQPQQLQGTLRRRAAVCASAAAPSLDGILAGLLELPPAELEKAVEDAFLVSWGPYETVLILLSRA